MENQKKVPFPYDNVLFALSNPIHFHWMCNTVKLIYVCSREPRLRSKVEPGTFLRNQSNFPLKVDQPFQNDL